MHSSTLNMTSVRYINFLKDLNSAIISGQTSCGKTVFLLDLLEGPCCGIFQQIVILCPTIWHSKTYLTHLWVWSDNDVHSGPASERLQEYLQVFYHALQEEPTQYTTDDFRLPRKKNGVQAALLTWAHVVERLSPHSDI